MRLVASTRTPGQPADQPLGDVGGGVEHVLAVVQHEQPAARGQVLDRPVEPAASARRVDADRVAHGSGHVGRQRCGSQLAPPHAVGEAVVEPAGELRGEARLPGAAHTVERHQRSFLQERGGAREMVLAAVEATGARGHARPSRPVGRGRGGRRLLVSRLGGQLVGEDAALELACLGGGLQAQLAQRGGERAIGGERLDLAAGAIQGDHQRPGEVLVQRVLGREPFELAGRLRRPPELDERARPVRLGPPAQLVEAPDLGLGEVDAGQLRERRPAPQRQRFVEGAQPDGRGQRRGPVHQRLEASRVHLLGRDLQPVAGAGTRQRGRGQEPAQVRQAHRQRARRGAGIDPGPRGLQQRVGRDRAAGVEQQAAEDEALLGSRRRGRAGAVDLQRPEHAELHRRDPTPRPLW